MNGCSVASSMTALVCPSNSTGSTMMLTVPGLAETGDDGDEIRRHVGEQNALLFHRALPDETLAELDRLEQAGSPLCA